MALAAGGSGATALSAAPVSATTLAPGSILILNYANLSPASSPGITAFAPGANGAATPSAVSTGIGFSQPYGIAFDPSGNGSVWVVDYFTNSVTEYSAAQLASGGSLTPVATIDSTAALSLNSPDGIAFDSSGNMWVANGNGGTGNAGSIVEYTASQLAQLSPSNNAPAPAVTLTPTATGGFNDVYGLTFDGNGNLWVASYTNSEVMEFKAAQLAASGSPAAAVTISADANGSLNSPSDLAFGPAGNLWVENSNAFTGTNTGSIVEYMPSQLGVSGAPAPAVTLTSNASGSINQPNGIAFDPAGNLWVANYGGGSSGTVSEFSPAELAAGGTPDPVTFLTPTATHSNLSGPDGVLVVPGAPGYHMVASDGGIFTFGGANFYGSEGGKTLNKPIVGMATTPYGLGYWEVASDGGIFTFGDAGYYGSEGGTVLNKPIVGMAATPDGKGYWLVASDGGIFSFGDAGYYGSMGGKPLNKAIVGMAATPDGKGYWLVASDGGIFSFGDANFYGSTGAMTLNKAIVGMAAAPYGQGYWLVASDGGIFSFGDAKFYGSTGAMTLNKPIVGMAPTPGGAGYWLVASDGGIFSFGDAKFYGSTGAMTLNKPIVAMSGL
ncbi:MAG: hypothetical protein M0Z92_00945 [Actinomycetota bacterium]|nr:hypothetical protein [Actinomycetota bacterium]